MAPAIQYRYCFIDIDIDNHRSKLGLTAAFVNATDSRYGFSSKDLRLLGGSELSRIHSEDLIACDHDFAPKLNEVGGFSVSHNPKVDGGRIVLELFWDKAPLACENFMVLCGASSATDGRRSNSKGNSRESPIGVSGKPLSYVGSKIHRVIRGFIMQGGDFVMGNGAGGESIFNGKKFKDERPGLLLKHDRRGILSMGNSGKNSNSSQFFLTFGPAPQCDGKHVIFGKVISGFDVMDAVESVSSSSGGEPQVPVSIMNTGVFVPLVSPGQGYFFDQPDDSFAGSSPHFMSRPRVGIIAPSTAVLSRFCEILSTTATIVPILDAEGSNPKNVAQDLLEVNAIDVVIIAPICKDKAPSIPISWQENKQWTTIGEKKVVLIAKPIECMRALENSWVYGCDWYL